LIIQQWLTFFGPPCYEMQNPRRDDELKQTQSMTVTDRQTDRHTATAYIMLALHSIT